MSSTPFIHLRVHSTYSLLEGAVSIKDLVGWCKKQSMPAVAIADTHNLFGSLEFSLAARKAGIQPIHACKFRLIATTKTDNAAAPSLQEDEILLIVQNETGWQNLLYLISQSYMAPDDSQLPCLSVERLTDYNAGLLALTGSHYSFIGKSLISKQSTVAEQYLKMLHSLFPNRLYLELMRHNLPDERTIEASLLTLAKDYNIPVVATNDVYFKDKKMYEAHDAFICIAEGRYVDEPNRRRLTPEHYLKTAEEMKALFADIPEAIENTCRIAQRTGFAAPDRNPILPRFTDGTGSSSEEDILRDQALSGLEERLTHQVYQVGVTEEEKVAIKTPNIPESATSCR